MARTRLLRSRRECISFSLLTACMPRFGRPTVLPPGVRGDIYRHRAQASSLFGHVTFKKGGIPTGAGCGGTSAEDWMAGM